MVVDSFVAPCTAGSGGAGGLGGSGGSAGDRGFGALIGDEVGNGGNGGTGGDGGDGGDGGRGADGLAAQIANMSSAFVARSAVSAPLLPVAMSLRIDALCTGTQAHLAVASPVAGANWTLPADAVVAGPASLIDPALNITFTAAGRKTISYGSCPFFFFFFFFFVVV